MFFQSLRQSWIVGPESLGSLGLNFLPAISVVMLLSNSGSLGQKDPEPFGPMGQLRWCL